MKQILLLLVMLWTTSGFASTLEVMPVQNPNIMTIVLPPEIRSGAFDLLIAELSMNKYDEIHLFITGDGGSTNAVLALSTALRGAKDKGTKITVDVTGPAISGHAFLACTASVPVKMHPGSSVTFHRSGIYRVALYFFYYREYPVDQADLVAEATIIASCLQAGLITADDVTDIYAGKRVTYSKLSDGSKLHREVLNDYENSPLEWLRTLAEIAVLICGSIVLVGICKRV